MTRSWTHSTGLIPNMTLSALDWSIVVGYFAASFAIGVAFYRRAGTNVPSFSCPGDVCRGG